MKKFEDKLKECAANRGRQKVPDETMPFRFAEDVLNRLSRPVDLEDSNERLWFRFGLRTLAGVTIVMLILSMLPSATETPSHLLPPPIEHSIVDHSGLL